MWIDLFGVNSFIISLVKHKVTISHQIPHRSCQRSWLSFDSASTWILTIISICIALIPETWLDCTQAIKFSRHSETSTNIRADPKRRAKATNQSTLTTRTATTWPIFISVIKTVPKHVVVCFNGLASLRNVGSNKRNKSHAVDECHVGGLFYWYGIKLWCKSAICLVVFHQDGLLYTTGYAEKWREWVFLNVFVLLWFFLGIFFSSNITCHSFD